LLEKHILNDYLVSEIEKSHEQIRKNNAEIERIEKLISTRRGALG